MKTTAVRVPLVEPLKWSGGIRESASGLVVEVEGAGAGAVPLDESHLVVRSMRAAFELLGEQPAGLRLRCRNVVPHARGLGSSSAAIVEECGSDMPTASTDDDIVFAVYMPPHAPTPGSALRSMHSKSSFDIFPALKEPTDSKTETICRSCPLCLPGLIVPP